tara:strand:+ start:97 stop:552 length:456 start_codon:yes stop_codon:yes gene_type:complete
MTPSEYKELIKKDTIKIGEDVEMTDSVTELFNELVDDGHDADDLQAFIDEYSKSQFVDYIEEYLQAIDQYDEEVVESFLEIFSIEDICNLSESYQGQWNSGAEFAQNLAEDCCEVPREMSSWIEIDWKASWDNLSYDYTEGNGGHIFSQNF